MESHSHSPQSSVRIQGEAATPAYYPPGYTPEPTQRKSPWGRLAGIAIAAGLLIFKFGKVALLALGKVKFLTTSFSALISIAAYAMLWTWKFAIGFVILLFIHEMGHVWQLRREGIKASAPVFIPFLGAAVLMKELPKDALAEARVGLAGPVLGTLGCLIPLALWGITGDELFQALAYIGFFLNLFNLLPVLPLDGGRAMAALSPWMWAVGYAVLIGLTILAPSPVLILVVILGGYESWRRWKDRKSPESQRYHEVSGRNRLIVATVYIGLAALLAVAMQLTYLPMSL